MDKERSRPEEQHFAGRDEHGRGIRVEQPCPVGAVNASNVHASRRAVGHVVKEMTAVGQELGEAMPTLQPLGGTRQERGVAARVRDTRDRTVRNQRVQDHAVTTPGTPGADRCPRERPQRAAVDIDAIDHVVREEPDRSAVRRPERKRRAVGAGERSRRTRRHRAQPQLGPAIGGRDERELLSVRRDRHRHHVGRRRRRDLDAHLRKRCCRCFRAAASTPRPRPPAARALRTTGGARAGETCRERSEDATRGASWCFVDLETGIANVGQPPLAILFQTPAQQTADAVGCVGGQTRPLGLARGRWPQSSRSHRCRRTLARPRAFRTARIRRPRCRSFCPRSSRAPARGSCTAPCRGRRRGASSRGW